MKKPKTILPSKMYGPEKKTENTKRGNLLKADHFFTADLIITTKRKKFCFC